MTNKRPTSTRRKLCFFLMMLACLLQAQSIAAQSVSVSFKDTPLKEILNAVEKQVDFTFVYNDNLVNVNKKFSVSVSNTDLKTFLTQLLKDSGYEYKIVEKQIVISPASFANSNSNQQTNQTASARQTSGPITVTGAVTDAATGEPLSFITVFVKDSKLSVTTRENGTYSIQVPSANSVLQYSCIGYEPAEVAINGRSKVDVQMKSTSTSLEAVVVTGFSTVDRRIFTGSSVKLKAEDIKTDGIIDIGRMLEGQAAGVSVQNVSGTFGTAPKIRVRGYTSISGENKPLWVVDGVVLEDLVNVSNDELSSGDPMTLLGSAVAGINANDIESFDILKDAAATALYGARAMNGVIVITTKRGKEGKPRITYNGNYNILMKPTYSQYNIMNSAEQMSVMAEMERKGFLNSNLINSSNSGIYGKMWKRIYTYDETNGQFGLENTPESRRNFLMRYAYANTDWFDLLFRNGLQQDHTLSISGGSTNSKTYASVSFYRDGGWTIGDNVNRYTMNFRNDYTVTDRLTLALSTMGSFRQQLTPGATSRMANNVSGGYERDFDINPFSYALNTSRALTAYDENGDLEYFTMSYCPFNIINELGKNTLNTTVIDTKILGELGYKITNDLKFQFTGSLRYNSAKREQEVREGSVAAEAYRADYNSTIRAGNRFLYKDPDNPNAEAIVVLPYGGFYYLDENVLLNYDMRANLTYTKTFKDIHAITAFVGASASNADRQINAMQGVGYQYEQGGIPFIDYRIMKWWVEQGKRYYGMSKYSDRKAAFYANADYSFKHKYSITLTGRYEGSNQMGSSPSARWLPTWSVSGKWNIGMEPFMQAQNVFTNLSIRAGYGLTASMNPNASAGAVFYNQSTRRPYTSEIESSIVIDNLENSELTWEKARSLNVGIDGNMFHNRLSFNVEYWNRASFDLIQSIKVSGIGGAGYKYANSADMKGYGFDVTLNGTLLQQQDWTWKVNATFGYADNEITRYEGRPTINSLVRPNGGNTLGHPVKSLYSIVFDSLDPANGMPLLIDQTGNVARSVNTQSTETKYLKYEGPVDPPYSGGFGTNLRWKDLTLNVLFTYQAGNKIRLYPSFSNTYSDLTAFPKEFADRWVEPGDELRTTIPSIMDAYTASVYSGTYPYIAYNYSTERVAKGDFIRLKNISLAYTLPKKYIEPLKVIKDIRATLGVTNVWLLYSDKKLKGQDPEFFNSGGVAMPINTQFTMTLNVSF